MKETIECIRADAKTARDSCDLTPFATAESRSRRAKDIASACDLLAPPDLPLDDTQSAVLRALCTPDQVGLHLLTGPPGTGKTHLLRRIISACAHRGVAVAATSASAARVLLPGYADTVHATFNLSISRHQSAFTVSAPSAAMLRHCSVFVIDEFSMLTSALFEWSLQRIREAQDLHDGATAASKNLIILAGDPCQLPCVCRSRFCAQDAAKSFGLCPTHHIAGHYLVERAFRSGAHHTLTTNHRNPAMAALFASIRQGGLSQRQIDDALNNGRVRAKPPIGAVVLCSHRDLVRSARVLLLLPMSLSNAIVSPDTHSRPMYITYTRACRSRHITVPLSEDSSQTAAMRARHMLMSAPSLNASRLAHLATGVLHRLSTRINAVSSLAPNPQESTYLPASMKNLSPPTSLQTVPSQMLLPPVLLLSSLMSLMRMSLLETPFLSLPSERLSEYLQTSIAARVLSMPLLGILHPCASMTVGNARRSMSSSTVLAMWQPLPEVTGSSDTSMASSSDGRCFRYSWHMR